MDVFIERIVKRQKSLMEIIAQVVIMALSILTGVFIMLIAPVVPFLKGIIPLLFLGVAFMIIGAKKLISRFDIEYEYAFTNGELDIDMIIAKGSRKRLLNVKCSELEIFKPYDPVKFSKHSYKNILYACSSINAENLWCFVTHQKEKGNILVVFEPDDRMLNSIKPFLKRTVAADAFGWN